MTLSFSPPFPNCRHAVETPTLMMRACHLSRHGSSFSTRGRAWSWKDSIAVTCKPPCNFSLVFSDVIASISLAPLLPAHVRFDVVCLATSVFWPRRDPGNRLRHGTLFLQTTSMCFPHRDFKVGGHTTSCPGCHVFDGGIPTHVGTGSRRDAWSD